jgi:endonuclease YncB( thermonuclease family)
MQAAPNVIVIYPPQGAPMAGPETAHPSMQIYQPMQPDTPQTGQAAQEETADHYLFAFKDHSIYSAVAYWVDGDTLHYFTNGSTHNQASLSLLDRDLTMRLNKESGAELKLPPVK